MAKVMTDSEMVNQLPSLKFTSGDWVGGYIWLSGSSQDANRVNHMRIQRGGHSPPPPPKKK